MFVTWHLSGKRHVIVQPLNRFVLEFFLSEHQKLPIENSRTLEMGNIFADEEENQQLEDFINPLDQQAKFFSVSAGGNQTLSMLGPII